MANQVRTEFTAVGVEKYLSSFDLANNKIDSFAAKTTSSFTNTTAPISKSFTDIKNEIGKSLTEINTKVESLKKPIESFAPKPTTSRYWENEAAEVKKSVDAIKKDVESLSKLPGNPGQESLDRIAQGIGYGDSPKKTTRTPLIDTAKLYGESRFNEGAAFRKIGEEAEKAGEKVARLRGKTTEFQRTLLELTDDFAPRGFNRPFNSIGRELFGRYNDFSPPKAPEVI